VVSERAKKGQKGPKRVFLAVFGHFGVPRTLETLEIWGPRGLRTLDLATFGPFWGPFGRVLFEACSVLTTFR
jgi:hypothetical protein